MIFLGFASIQSFSRYSFLAAKRRAVVQNEVTVVLEHLTKSITGTNYSGGAIGNTMNFPIHLTTIDTLNGIAIWIDTGNGLDNTHTPDGKLETDGPYPDGQVEYVYDPGTHQILFYSGATPEYITTGHIVADKDHLKDGPDTHFYFNENINYLDVKITGRWDPSNLVVSKDNPEVVMYSRIKMPGVSSN